MSNGQMNKFMIVLGGALCVSALIVGCQTSAKRKQVEIATVPATTLARALETTTAAALLETEDSTRYLRVTNALTEEKPQFAFQVFSVKSVQELTDTPMPSLLVIHNDGSIAVFSLSGWDQARDLGNGYDIWYKGEAVTCTIYTATTGQVVRINSTKTRGQEDHDKLVEHVMRFVPPMPPTTPEEAPIVINGPRLRDGRLSPLIFGLGSERWDTWAHEIAWSTK